MNSIYFRASEVYYLFQRMTNPDDVLFRDDTDLYSMLTDLYSMPRRMVGQSHIDDMRQLYGGDFNHLQKDGIYTQEMLYNVTAHKIDAMLIRYYFRLFY